ncbi:hypothetical protein [Parapedobacter soli]|uniref:hypothetical protein n=1 Tax=Parapedobacter soli TaxID=416955 RepID=UPI0021CA146A|nr:hypothetical protein [Parapedobacter soli]
MEAKIKRMTFEHKSLSDFLSVPDGTYYHEKLVPGSPYKVKEMPDKDGFLPLHQAFKKEDIPQHHLLKENPDGSLSSDKGDVFRPNYKLAESDDDRLRLIDGHLSESGSTDLRLFAEDVLLIEIEQLFKKIRSTGLRNLGKEVECLRNYQSWIMSVVVDYEPEVKEILLRFPDGVEKYTTNKYFRKSVDDIAHGKKDEYQTIAYLCDKFAETDKNLKSIERRLKDFK